MLAQVPRIYDRFRAGSLLDRGPVSLRHREIVIDRTCARCGCAYEWGVHIAFFADRTALTPEQVRATVRDNAKDAAWSDEELLLIRLVDELHDAADISDWLWKALATAFSIEQIFELIALVGFYHSLVLRERPEARSRALRGTASSGMSSAGGVISAIHSSVRGRGRFRARANAREVVVWCQRTQTRQSARYVTESRPEPSTWWGNAHPGELPSSPKSHSGVIANQLRLSRNTV